MPPEIAIAALMPRSSEDKRPIPEAQVANFTKTGDVFTFWQESWCLEAFVPEARP